MQAHIVIMVAALVTMTDLVAALAMTTTMGLVMDACDDDDVGSGSSGYSLGEHTVESCGGY